MEDPSREASSEKRRRRPPLACVACRRRKVRCDRRLPCQNCVKARRAVSCAYVPDERLEPRETTQKFTDAINRSTADADDVVRATIGGGTSQRTGATTASRYLQSESNTNGEGEALRERVRKLEKQLEQVLESRRAGVDTAPGTTSVPLRHNDSGPSFARVLEEQEECDVTRRPGYMNAESMGSSGMRQMLVKSRYLGGSHWMRGLSLLPPRKTLINVIGRLKSDKTSEIYQAIDTGKRLGRSIKAARVPSLVSLEYGQRLPHKEVADKLLEAYFRTFEKLHRVINVPSFRQEYQHYWKDSQKARQSFIIQLQLCMALGTLVQDDKYSMRSLAAQWIYEARLWMLQASEKSQIDLSGLQIMCLAHLARNACGVGADLVWASAGTLMRMALYTGLHRDPDHLPKMSLLTAETRRRLWATVMEILVLSSMESGGPPLVAMHDFDTKAPGNFNDEELLDDHNSTTPASPHPTTEFTDTSIQIALFSSMPIRLQISSYLNDFRSAPTYDKTLALSSDLTLACRSFDAILRIYQTQTPSLSDFQLPVTKQIIQHYFLALHLPWLGLAKNDARYYFSRKTCVDVAFHNQREAMVHGFLGTENGAKPDDFGRLLICASSGFRYIGFQCLLILITVLIWELEEHRTALRTLDNSGSDLNSATRTPDPAGMLGMSFGLSGSRTNESDEIVNVIRRSPGWTLARIKAGEINVKGYYFGALMLAEFEGLLKGLNDTELAALLQKAASEVVGNALEILKGIYAAEVGDEDSAQVPGMDLMRSSRYREVEGSQTTGAVEDLESMNIGSSSTLNDWDWDALDDPNYNFNLNLGALDLIFGNESM
ncbi:hypothetical protein N0V93_007634 [Gnomoniopsis smithogilvyi]|uniref:Zn(2)-C6 fungal-type domain-containing protein n=1 Tax=Gnomoniopsis smithogilvyi TaxID=1191159 RepID=A0A9W8YQU7_9PEZI|nr:hypothetical protein N0V93_007634 [Gnomoniopsis smithogilvyi]